LCELANLRHLFAVVSIRDMAYDEHQERRGDELDQSHHPQREGAVRQGINLPPDSDARDLIRELREATREEIEKEGRMAKQNRRSTAGDIRHRASMPNAAALRQRGRGACGSVRVLA
jgi:hypothetical protein